MSRETRLKESEISIISLASLCYFEIHSFTDGITETFPGKLAFISLSETTNLNQLLLTFS